MARTMILFLLCSCAEKDPSADFQKESNYEWPGGVFQMTTTAVEDNCLNDVFVPLFLAEGEDTSNDWEYTTELPSWDDMEFGSSYTIELQEPFSSMAVTVGRGEADGQAIMTGSRQTGITVNEELYPGCLVDMGFDALIILNGPANVTGYVTLTVDNADGEFCPEFDIPCTVEVDFTGLAAQ
jgi:hypothetical protein